MVRLFLLKEWFSLKAEIKLKVIKAEQQYHSYLEEVHRLLSLSPKPGSELADQLELLTTLLEAYENKKYPVEVPDPIDAILFRMHERGLKQADLVPYFGTRSRVSEILARKRPLTVPMIRALSIGLGISTDTLVGVVEDKKATMAPINWASFPINEMVTRGWIRKISGKSPVSIESEIKEFVAQFGWQFGTQAAFKKSLSGDAYSAATQHALYAWLARIIQRSREKKGLGKFRETALTNAFLKKVAQLSWFDEGPKLAIEFLEKNGIAVVLEPHLKGTMLDGAAVRDIDGRPIIGLTLRYDRVDNFWFTLLHEVAHIWKHVGRDEVVLDDLDVASIDRREIEANRLAREAFIPRVIWKRSKAYLSPTRENIFELAHELKINPAVIAGRLRKEKANYRQFADLVGQGEVRRQLLPSNGK
jgi:HTH-type transcriptional regulator/antitoxin HigA